MRAVKELDAVALPLSASVKGNGMVRKRDVNSSLDSPSHEHAALDVGQLGDRRARTGVSVPRPRRPEVVRAEAATSLSGTSAIWPEQLQAHQHRLAVGTLAARHPQAGCCPRGG